MSSTNPFASLFRRSPFKLLQEHMREVVACVNEVPDLFKALTENDEAKLNEQKEKIFTLEGKADAIKNDLRENLPRGLFMPVDRRDLLEILNFQDSIADVAQDIAGLLVERDMTIPEPMAEPLTKFVDKCVDVTHKCLQAIEEMDELLEVGFKGKRLDSVEVILSELNRVEDVTDEMGMNLCRILFDHEDDMKPVSVIFWYQLLQWIGDMADNAEKVGNRLRLLIAR